MEAPDATKSQRSRVRIVDKAYRRRHLVNRHRERSNSLVSGELALPPVQAAALGADHPERSEAAPRAASAASLPSIFVLRWGDQTVVAVLTLAVMLIIVAKCFMGADSLGPAGTAWQSPRAIEFRVDINTATWPELTLLPDIGEARAQLIVAAHSSGPFRSIADLDRRVKGLGPVIAARLEPYLLPLPDSPRPAAPERARSEYAMSQAK
jgi:DNA uptake protein ComE-like DNA-binding protein